VGPRNDRRSRTFDSLDVQLLREFRFPFAKEPNFKVGWAVFNSLDHFNPRDVQTTWTAFVSDSSSTVRLAPSEAN